MKKLTMQQSNARRRVLAESINGQIVKNDYNMGDRGFGKKTLKEGMYWDVYLFFRAMWENDLTMRQLAKAEGIILRRQGRSATTSKMPWKYDPHTGKLRTP